MSRVYKYILTHNGNSKEVYPISKGTRQGDRESGYKFKRYKWNGNLVFQGEDHDLIISQDIETRFEILIELRDEDGYYNTYFPGYFNRVDCNIDEINRITTVVPLPDDKYEPILTQIDKEIDIVPLLEDKLQTVDFQKNSVLQIYFPGSTVINNVIPKSSWEHDVSPESDRTKLQDDYHFIQTGDFLYVPAVELGLDVSGIYDYDRTDGFKKFYKRGDNVYEIELYTLSPKFRVFIREVGGASLYTHSKNTDTAFEEPEHTGSEFNESFTMRHNDHPTHKCRVFRLRPHMRMLTNYSEVNGVPTERIPDDDLVDEHFDYRRVIGIDRNELIFVSSNRSVTDNGYGKTAIDAANYPNEYFATVGSPIYPLDFSLWREYSLWVTIDTWLLATFSSINSTQSITHCYKLTDVINAMVGDLGSTATIQEDTTHSKFLFEGATNPVRDFLSTIMITPKSNIGTYDKAATVGKIKMSDINALLMMAYNAYWWIEGEDELHIEQERYFHKGGSYTNDVVGIDLTTLIEPQHNVAWGFRNKSYTYDKPQIPDLIEFEWMDTVSNIFAGYPIQCNSNYVQAGNKETRSLSLFTSDVEHLIYKRSDYSPDGFLLMETIIPDTYNIMDEVTINYEGNDYEVVNGKASWMYLADKYHRDGLPCTNVNLNNEDITATSVKRNKVQSVVVPNVDFPELQLIKTLLGNGLIRTEAQNQSDGSYKLTVEHDA